LANPFESLILFKKKHEAKNELYNKSGALAQKEDNLDRLSTGKMAKRVQPGVKIGDQRSCPECRTTGNVVWISQDKKTMGVQCHKSHREASRPATKFGATIVPSTKTRKNIVFLTAAA
jgi:hypothetical protein